MSHYLASELWRVAGLLVVGLLLGLVAGSALGGLLAAVLAYTAWSLFNLVRLIRCLRRAERSELPAPAGLWGEAFDELYRLQRRYRRRRRYTRALINQFRESTDAMPDGTVVMTEQGEMQWWNQAASRLLGLSTSRDVGQRISNLVREPRFTAYIESGDFDAPVQFPAPADEQRTVSAVIVPYGDRQRLLMLRDVTHQLRLERMRHDFVANVSHELRTPVTVIAGFLESLREEDDECTRRWGRTLELMHQQSERMSNLVEDLLMLSSLEHSDSLAEETVSVPDMLEALCSETESLAGLKGQQVSADVDRGVYLRANPRELDSAFKNLLVNAVRYTPPGGEVALRWWADAEGAHLSVKDTGIGIAEHHIPRITERFYRVEAARSRESGGTGLGLAIVKHVLLRHGARLEIRSRPGRGSTFLCHFPVERILREEKGRVS